MTKSRVVVSLAESYMTLNVMQAAPSKGISQTWRRWGAYLHGMDAPFERIAHSVTVEGNTGMQGLAILFHKGLDTLKRNQSQTLDGTPIEVVLGPSLSHVGILEMTSDGGTKLSEADKNSYVQAWILQTWAIQPDECVVRYVPISGGNRYLVTCVERYIVDAIDTLCAQEGLRLSSCKPAMAKHLAALVNTGSQTAVINGAGESQAVHHSVFIECNLSGGRANVVHFLTLNRSAPTSIIRMWLPNPRDGSKETGIAEVVQRLHAQYRSLDAKKLDLVSWPDRLDGATSP
jgi:hypothetical protein